MRTSLRTSLSLLLVTLLSGCDLIGDVVEFGLWTVLILLLLAAAAVYVIVKVFFD